MSEIVDLTKFRMTRQLSSVPTSALDDCLLCDTLEDLNTVAERIQQAKSLNELALTEYDVLQLEYFSYLADQILDKLEEFGFNEVEEFEIELTDRE